MSGRGIVTVFVVAASAAAGIWRFFIFDKNPDEDDAICYAALNADSFDEGMGKCKSLAKRVSEDEKVEVVMDVEVVPLLFVALAVSAIFAIFTIFGSARKAFSPG